MSVVRLSDFAAPWATAGGAVVAIVPDGPHPEAPQAMRLILPGPGAEASLAPAAPLDLSEFAGLRLWLRGPRGGAVDFGWEDATDPPGAARFWRLVVPQSRWTQISLGVAAEARGAVARFLLRADGGAEATVADLLAVRPEMFADVEAAILARIDAPLALPGATGLPLAAAAATGAAQVAVASTQAFAPNALIEIDDGAGGGARFRLAAVTQGPQTALSFADGAVLAGPLTAGVATVTLLAPAGAAPEAGPPAVRLTLLDAREDRRRIHYATLREPARLTAAGARVAERPAPRGWLLDWQLTAEGATRAQTLALLDHLQARFGVDRPLVVAGALAPVEVFLRPDLPRDRAPSLPAALHLRVCAQAEAGVGAIWPAAAEARLTVRPDGAPAEPVVVAP